MSYWNSVVFRLVFRYVIWACACGICRLPEKGDYNNMITTFLFMCIYKLHLYNIINQLHICGWNFISPAVTLLRRTASAELILLLRPSGPEGIVIVSHNINIIIVMYIILYTNNICEHSSTRDSHKSADYINLTKTRTFM